jgi:alpha,alpha-trehalose phosphorylase
MGEALSFTPHIPEKWARLSFHVQWRGRKLLVEIDPSREQLQATLLSGQPVRIIVSGREKQVRTGRATRFTFG